jgi:hypothetical protein
MKLLWKRETILLVVLLARIRPVTCDAPGRGSLLEELSRRSYLDGFVRRYAAKDEKNHRISIGLSGELENALMRWEILWEAGGPARGEVGR